MQRLLFLIAPLLALAACREGPGPCTGTLCIDECATGTDDCDTNAACMNTDGSFDCTCFPGFTGDGRTCMDIDECTGGTDDCDANADCMNIMGSFTCACRPGYAGNG